MAIETNGSPYHHQEEYHTSLKMSTKLDESEHHHSAIQDCSDDDEYSGVNNNDRPEQDVNVEHWHNGDGENLPFQLHQKPAIQDKLTSKNHKSSTNCLSLADLRPKDNESDSNVTANLHNIAKISNSFENEEQMKSIPMRKNGLILSDADHNGNGVGV